MKTEKSAPKFKYILGADASADGAEALLQELNGGLEQINRSYQTVSHGIENICSVKNHTERENNHEDGKERS